MNPLSDLEKIFGWSRNFDHLMVPIFGFINFGVFVLFCGVPKIAYF
jgi:hypothetical protein